MLGQNAKAASERRAAYGAKVFALLRRLFSAVTVKGSTRRLRVCETLSLGEKRFIAVVECDRRAYLLAGTPHNISLLQCLDGGPESLCPDRCLARDT